MSYTAAGILAKKSSEKLAGAYNNTNMLIVGITAEAITSGRLSCIPLSTKHEISGWQQTPNCVLQPPIFITIIMVRFS